METGLNTLSITALTTASTHRVQTFAEEYVFLCNAKLVHNIEIKLITKIAGITVLISSESSASLHIATM